MSRPMALGSDTQSSRHVVLHTGQRRTIAAQMRVFTENCTKFDYFAVLKLLQNGQFIDVE